MVEKASTDYTQQLLDAGVQFPIGKVFSFRAQIFFRGSSFGLFSALAIYETEISAPTALTFLSEESRENLKKNHKQDHLKNGAGWSWKFSEIYV